MPPDRWELYRHMLRSRLFEEAVRGLWNAGLISGEMHLGTGEEAIMAGVVTQLREGDALALDHRGTSPLLMRGVDPLRLLKEFLGRPDGLCRGQGGHMHLYSAEHLAASSGIVGAAGPAAAGFALAAQFLRPGMLAVAFFGEGAMNQGMLMESMNLASAWKLPVLFVCKDDRWAITTPSAGLTGGTLVERARGLGLHAVEVDGVDVEAVWRAAEEAIAWARGGDGPTFLHATCVHLDGHFLGMQLLRAARDPLWELAPQVGPLLRSAARRKGASVPERLRSLWDVSRRGLEMRREQTDRERDPVRRAREGLAPERDRLNALEREIAAEIHRAVEAAVGAAEGAS